MAENTPASDEDMSGNEGEEVGPTPPTDPLLDEEPPINQILFHARQIATHLVTAKKARKAEIGLPLPPDHRHDTGATVARSYIQDYRPQLDEKLQAVADITVSTLQDLSAFTQELALESQRNTRLYTVAREIGSEIREVIEKSTVTMSLQDMNGHLLPSEICVGLPENILRMEDSALAENLPLLCSMLGDPCFAKVMDRTAAGIPFLDLNHRYINYSSKKYPANPRQTGSPYQAKRARIEEMTPPEDKYPTKFLEKMNSRFGIVAEEAVYPSDFPARTSTLISPNLSLATTNSLPGDGGFETVPILLFDSHVHNNSDFSKKVWGRKHVVVVVKSPHNVTYTAYAADCMPPKPDGDSPPRLIPRTAQSPVRTFFRNVDAFIIEERGNKLLKFVPDSESVIENEYAVMYPRDTQEDLVLIGFGKHALMIHLEKKTDKFIVTQGLYKTVASVAQWNSEPPPEYPPGVIPHGYSPPLPKEHTHNYYNAVATEPGEEAPGPFAHDNYLRLRSTFTSQHIVVYQLDFTPERPNDIVHPTQLPPYKKLDHLENLHSEAASLLLDTEGLHAAREAAAKIAPRIAPARPNAPKKSVDANNPLFDAMAAVKYQANLSGDFLRNLSKHQIRSGRLCLYSATTRMSGGKLAYVTAGGQIFLTTKATLLTLPGTKIGDAVMWAESMNTGRIAVATGDDETLTHVGETVGTLHNSGSTIDECLLVSGVLEGADEDKVYEKFVSWSGYAGVSATGRSRVESLKEELFSRESRENYQSTELFMKFMDHPDGMYPSLPQDFCKIQAFLELMLNESQNIVVDLSDDDLDPVAFEIILDHMRLVRLFRCGFADPGPLELPEDPQLKTAVEHALKVLRVDAHSY